MRKIATKKWSELKTDWQRLQDVNAAASPFQSYEFLSRTGKGNLFYTEPFRLVGLKELNLVLYEDGEPIAVAALLHKKTKGRHLCYLRGHFTAASYLDIMHKPGSSYADFQALMDEAKKQLGSVAFQFDRIRDDTVTSRYMSAYFASGETNRHECARISLEQSYDSWLQSLHKSTRQSLNNRRNRLLTDRADWSADIRRGCDVDKSTYKKAMRVCAERYMTKKAFRFGPLSGLAKKALAALLLRENVSQWVAQSADSLVALLRINGEIAAFASMVVCRDKRVTGIRFAISARYARYSPGGLLLSELVRYLIEARQKGELNADQLDMGQGVSGGASYKYAYGGETCYLMFYFLPEPTSSLQVETASSLPVSGSIRKPATVTSDGISGCVRIESTVCRTDCSMLSNPFSH